jgi:hypothetical protein
MNLLEAIGVLRDNAELMQQHARLALESKASEQRAKHRELAKIAVHECARITAEITNVIGVWP